MNRLGYLFLRGLADVFRLIPFPVLYIISDIFAFVLQHVVGYRRKVMDDNLALAFPEKTEDERRRIRSKAYRNITDIILETLKGFTMSIEATICRWKVLNPEVPNKYLEKGQSIMLGGSHVNSWEWMAIAIPPALKGTMVTAFKPVKNLFLDEYYTAKRAKSGMVMVNMNETYPAMRKLKDETCCFILLSDQSPSSRKSAHWVDFFGIDTAFLPGLDFLARRFQYPAVYYEVKRVRRGYYEVMFTDICSDTSKISEGDITRAYADMLEKTIRQQPENWLWSHKRWKMNRENV